MFPGVDRCILFRVLYDPTGVYPLDDLKAMVRRSDILGVLCDFLDREIKLGPHHIPPLARDIFLTAAFWTSWLLSLCGPDSVPRERLFQYPRLFALCWGVAQVGGLARLLDIFLRTLPVLLRANRFALFCSRFSLTTRIQ
jgi:hypothetical protein